MEAGGKASGRRALDRMLSASCSVHELYYGIFVIGDESYFFGDTFALNSNKRKSLTKDSLASMSGGSGRKLKKRVPALQSRSSAPQTAPIIIPGLSNTTISHFSLHRSKRQRPMGHVYLKR